MPDLTGAYRWPAGNRLARDLAAVRVFSGTRVLDLGCGQGQCGRRAVELGAAVVRFADGDPAVVAAMQAEGSVEVFLHRWGEPVPAGPYDVILGGDILYRPECFADLLRSIASGLAETGVALLSDPRPVLEPELPALAAAAGLSWRIERRADYTLVTLGLAERVTP